jgi:hypothetical protein
MTDTQPAESRTNRQRRGGGGGGRVRVVRIEVGATIWAIAVSRGTTHILGVPVVLSELAAHNEAWLLFSNGARKVLRVKPRAKA